MTKIGIFGGSFNPIHLGHIQSVVDVHEKLEMEKIYVVPAFLNPLKEPIEGPSPEQRLELTKVGMEDYGEFVEVDDQEIQRKGPSYSIETINKYKDQHPGEELHLILGMDTFSQFDSWKDYEQIVETVHLVVTSRPGNQLPFSIEDIPKGLRKFVAAFDRNYIELTTGTHIEFIKIEDVDVSATEVRKKLRTGHRVEKYLSFPVERFIKDNSLYEPIGDKIPDYKEFAVECGKLLNEKGAINTKSFDLSELEYPSEYTIIASGTSSRHASSLADYINSHIRDEFGVFPLAVEGLKEGRWVVMDYGTIIIHVFYDFARQEYRLEDLWKDGEIIYGPLDESRALD
ncbi:MAG: nicotinate (nicotinamide) nucleotide adenylyltransferase [Bdellovibrionales bacterium]